MMDKVGVFKWSHTTFQIYDRFAPIVDQCWLSEDSV